MANSIKDRVGGKIMIYNRTTGNFDYYSGSGNHTILLFDWRIESTLNVTGYSEACGNSLFASLMKGYFQGDFNLNDLHFVAHSRGTVVQGEAAERLLVSGYPVEHITNIDAHDFGLANICTDYDANPLLNEMGVIAWQGVTFNDSYWQDNPVPLIGRKVDGTYSIYLGGVLDGFNHVMIPDWYTGTVTNLNSSEGFRYSKLAGGIPIRPLPNYGTAIPTMLDFDNDGIVNGNFERGTDNYSYFPGWSYHGGSGSAIKENGHLKLNSGGSNRVSNRFYIPKNANSITFDYQVVSASQGSPPLTDKLLVKIGNDIVVSNIYLNSASSSYIHRSIDVRNYRNSVKTIEFLIQDASGNTTSINSETWIDNVKFEIGINLGRDTTMCIGDTLTIDAGNIGKGTGVTYLWSNGSNTSKIKVTTAGLYWVIGNKNNRIVKDSIVVSYVRPPVLELGNNIIACQGEQIVLDALNPNCHYQWNNTDITRYIAVSTTGLYKVSVTNNACPPIEDSLIINFVPKPAFELRSDTTVCNPINIGIKFDTTNYESIFFNSVDSKITPSYNLSISNNFTVEFWAAPEANHEIDIESNTGTEGISGQKYIVYPLNGDNIWGSGHAGMGISVGKNGVSVYEHSSGRHAPMLVWEGSIIGWNHIAVVYNNKQPYLYINGKLVKRGIISTKNYIHPSLQLGGGDYGYFLGTIDEFRVWDNVRWQSLIYQNMYSKMTGSELGLKANWSIDEHSTTMVYGLLPTMPNGTVYRATFLQYLPYFSAAEAYSFLWNNGDTSCTQLSANGISKDYILTISNPDGCSIKDTVKVNYDETLCENYGITDNSNHNFNIYPNPANSLINFYSEQFAANTTLSIYNSVGELLIITSIQNQLTQIDISKLSDGAYFMVVRNNSAIDYKSFIISR